MSIFWRSLAAATAVSVTGLGVGAALVIRGIGKALEGITFDLDDEDDFVPVSVGYTTHTPAFELDPVEDFLKHCAQLLEEHPRIDAAWTEPIG